MEQVQLVCFTYWSIVRQWEITFLDWYICTMCCLFVYSHSRSAWNKFIILEKEKVFAPNNIQIKHGTGQSLPCVFFDYSNDRNIKFSKISFCTLKWKTFFSLRRLKTKLTCHITIYIFYHISFFFYNAAIELPKEG